LICLFYRTSITKLACFLCSYQLIVFYWAWKWSCNICFNRNHFCLRACLFEKTCNRADQSTSTCWDNNIVKVYLSLLLKHLFRQSGISCHNGVIFKRMNKFYLSFFGIFSCLCDTRLIIRANLMNFNKLFSFFSNKLKLMFKTALRNKDMEFNLINFEVPWCIEATHAHDEAKFPSDAVTY